VVAKILRISSVTDYERALLVGHYLSVSDKPEIDPRLLDKGYTDEQIKEMRRHMGQNSAVGLNFRFTKELKEYVHPNFGFLYTLYCAWDTHHTLPFRGSFTDQPNRMVDYFEVLDGLKHETEKKIHAQAMKDSKKKGK
jgi:hypothetical protein